MNQLEKRARNTIFFFKGTKHDCKDYFNSLVRIDNAIHGKKNGFIRLKKCNCDVYYDSLYEKKILEELDKCYFIKKIKTQSLEITYKSRMSNKTRKYIPDIQLLLYDGSMVIVEIKPFKEMVNNTNMRKFKSLRKFCKENGYGISIIDKDYYSFEDLKKEIVADEIQEKFISFVKERNKVSFNECKLFKKENGINDYQICYIIWKNKSRLMYQQHVIIYKDRKKD